MGISILLPRCVVKRQPFRGNDMTIQAATEKPSPAARATGALLMACLLLLPGCGRKEEGSEGPSRLSIVIQSWVGYGPLYLASDKGFFAEEGLEILFVREELDAARCDALKAGLLDVEAGTIDQLVSKRASDTPVHAVAILDLSMGADAVVATRDIRNVHDLIGKRVALARNDVGETLLSFLFHKAGLSLDQITIVPRAPDKVAQAFLDGDVDAAVTWEPWVTRALARPGTHVVVSTRDEPGIIVDVLNVRTDILRENPEAVKKLLRGWYRAVEYCRAHPAEACRIIAPHFGVTAEEYGKQIAGLHWPSHKETLADFGNADNPGRLYTTFDTIADIKHKNGRIARKPRAADAIQPEILMTLFDNQTATR